MWEGGAIKIRLFKCLREGGHVLAPYCLFAHTVQLDRLVSARCHGASRVASSIRYTTFFSYSDRCIMTSFICNVRHFVLLPESTLALKYSGNFDALASATNQSNLVKKLAWSWRHCQQFKRIAAMCILSFEIVDTVFS